MEIAESSIVIDTRIEIKSIIKKAYWIPSLPQHTLLPSGSSSAAPSNREHRSSRRYLGVGRLRMCEGK